ncbi:hypothetical protein [Bacteroides luti]|uniref:hypothetical protein n=1 Tax=Bacteroides luti TaxID=1297750 RepID=UPI00111497A5|nr:hypothetical protein [Bacteroides luti]
MQSKLTYLGKVVNKPIATNYIHPSCTLKSRIFLIEGLEATLAMMVQSAQFSSGYPELVADNNGFVADNQLNFFICH